MSLLTIVYQTVANNGTNTVCCTGAELASFATDCTSELEQLGRPTYSYYNFQYILFVSAIFSFRR